MYYFYNFTFSLRLQLILFVFKTLFFFIVLIVSSKQQQHFQEPHIRSELVEGERNIIMIILCIDVKHKLNSDS